MAWQHRRRRGLRFDEASGELRFTAKLILATALFSKIWKKLKLVQVSFEKLFLQNLELILVLNHNIYISRIIVYTLIIYTLIPASICCQLQSLCVSLNVAKKRAQKSNK